MVVQASPADARGWDDAAAGWHRHGALIRQWLHGATQRLLDAAHIDRSAKVLDVAAGAGDQTLDIVQRLGDDGEVWVTDANPSMLALARETLRADGNGPRLRYQVADAQTLGMEGACFDAAICRLGLMFCTRPLAALQQLHSALRVGGRLSALVFAGPDVNPCIALTLRIARQHAGLPDADPFAPGSLPSLGRPGLAAQLLADAGFGEIAVTPIDAPFCVPRAEDYVDFVRSAGSPVIDILRPLSPARQAQAWQAIVDQLNQYQTPSGWQGPNELLLMSATRVPRREHAAASGPGHGFATGRDVANVQDTR